MSVYSRLSVVDPDLELRGAGGRAGFLLALLAFLPSMIFSFFTQNKGEGPGVSPRSATGCETR